jgi:hypothetical protein
MYLFLVYIVTQNVVCRLIGKVIVGHHGVSPPMNNILAHGIITETGVPETTTKHIQLVRTGIYFEVSIQTDLVKIKRSTINVKNPTLSAKTH